MNQTTNVVIVGGGIIGCAIAYYLRKSNVNVTIVDQGKIGTQASSAAAGLLAPLGSLSGPGAFADLLLASWNMFPLLAPELEEASGIHLEYEQSGSLRIVRNPKNTSNLRKRMSEWKPLGLQMQWLSGEKAHQHEPLLAADVCAAIYAPEEAQIKAPQLVKAFARAAANSGATFYSSREILGVARLERRVTGVYTAQDELIA